MFYFLTPMPNYTIAPAWAPSPQHGGTCGVRWGRPRSILRQTVGMLQCGFGFEAGCLEQLLLLVGLDGAVRGGVRHAREGEALAHLVVVEERAVRLVDGARGHLARAR